MCKSREWLVEGSQAFWIRDDVKLRTLGELATALAFMPGEVFAGYVSEGKNDFADWVASSFEEGELAESLRAAADQAGMRAAFLGAVGE